MWDSSKSVLLSRVATWIIIVLALILAVTLPFWYQSGHFPGTLIVPGEDGAIVETGYAFWLMPLYYTFLIPALIILFTLDRLLMAIQRGEVFTKGNVKRLRLISWCCFLAAFILALGVIPGAYFCLVLAILAVFFGIILRIVKNLFEAAVELKAENDYTI